MLIIESQLERVRKYRNINIYFCKVSLPGRWDEDEHEIFYRNKQTSTVTFTQHKPSTNKYMHNIILLLYIMKYHVQKTKVSFYSLHDAIMSAKASQITSLRIVYSIVYSSADQRIHQSSALMDLCVGNSPVTGEFPAQRSINAENVSIWWRYHATEFVS